VVDSKIRRELRKLRLTAAAATAFPVERSAEPIGASVQEFGGGANTQQRLLSGRRQINSASIGSTVRLGCVDMD